MTSILKLKCLEETILGLAIGMIQDQKVESNWYWTEIRIISFVANKDAVALGGPLVL